MTPVQYSTFHQTTLEERRGRISIIERLNGSNIIFQILTREYLTFYEASQCFPNKIRISQMKLVRFSGYIYMICLVSFNVLFLLEIFAWLCKISLGKSKIVPYIINEYI